MTPLNRTAILKADEIRSQHGFDIYQPINSIDLCLKLNILVRTVNINMEGMYFINTDRTNPSILLSNLRPFPRRFYTCGHELGHHLFGHGTKIDELKTNPEFVSYNEEELLVDCFAGALLMPIAGILAEFALRGWQPQNTSPEQFYTICSHFGVGYQTLITHCRTNKIISTAKAEELAKATPLKFLRSIIGKSVSASYFKIIDGNSEIPTIDLEVSNYIFLPNSTQISSTHLQYHCESSVGTCYLATTPGVSQIHCPKTGFSSFIRIQSFQFEGLAEFRHLEDK